MLYKNLAEILLRKHSIIHLSIYCLRKTNKIRSLNNATNINSSLIHRRNISNILRPERHLEEFKPELVKTKLPGSKIKCKSLVPT